VECISFDNSLYIISFMVKKQFVRQHGTKMKQSLEQKPEKSPWQNPFKTIGFRGL